jgi:hypothetical protein
MKKILGILIAVIIALVVGFVPIMEVTNTWLEFLSYEATAYTQEKQADSELQQIILSGVAFSEDPEEIREALELAYQKYVVAYVEVKNTDTEAGAFPLAIIFDTPEGEDRKTFDLYLEPGEAEVVKYSIAAPKGGWTAKHLIIPDLKTVTTTEKVTLFEYLRSRF